MNNRYQGYIRSFSVDLSHSPVKKRQLMYPFLVIEAKRENDAPGFRSVEAQTAFPIRRFLRIQDELQRASKIKLDPLVWFFAFQGEEWRLYAAILDDKEMVVRFPLKGTLQAMIVTKVSQQVFHLWHGNLESQDGALQIFQIVDFVWTWARDVYRPQIRRCLSGHIAYQREISPTSTNPFPRSQSVLSVPSARSFSQPLLDAMVDDDIMAEEVVSDNQPDFQEASSHPFLRWAGHCDVWTPNTSIRHSDIVMFSFRVLEIPENQQSFHDLIYSLRYNRENSTMMLHALKVILQNQYTLSLKRDQLHDIEKYWTGVNAQTSYGRSITNHPDQRIKTLLLFRTFCQQEDWQLRREVYCVIWSSRAASLLSMILETDINFSFDEDSLLSIQHSEFIRAFQQLRKLSGRRSVAYALHNTSLILLPCDDASGRGSQLQWRQPQSQGIPEHVIAGYVALFDSASCSEDLVQSYYHQFGRLLWVLRTEQGTDTPPDLERIPDNVGEGGAMLTVKPGAWPQQCPRFCLFVLLGHGFHDEAHLGRLLRYTIQVRDMYCVYEDAAQGSEPLTAADRHLLRSWEDSFNRETMPRG